MIPDDFYAWFGYNTCVMKYETVVGLEIHAHLKTESKMFCSCGTGPKGKEYNLSAKDEPNVRVCPICTGNPGTLPVANKKAIEDTILLGLALGSKIPEQFNFERKNYYYPDLPKAYQITSATNPPVIGGGLEIETENGPKVIELDHIHLEEDAGKLTHDNATDASLVDLNRAGTPLLEIITQPVLSGGAEAVEFMKNLRAILRALGISDADMEKGQMRCDANISVRPVGSKELGIKVEVKNMNSFKMVGRAIDYEAERQAEALERGEKISQETRGWDDNRGKTTPQRSKEFANDYRYFPEPDLPPFEIGKGKDFDPEVINDRLPELPREKKDRFLTEYGMSKHDAGILTADVEVAGYFEKVVENIPQFAENPQQKKAVGKTAASFITGEFLGKIDPATEISETKVTPENLATLIGMVFEEKISLKIAKEVFLEVLKTGKMAEDVITEKGLAQISDTGELEKIVGEVLDANPSQVESYKNGQEKLLGFFVGQVMAKTKGQANPKVVNDLLRKNLS
jgi:aspartyl-tRNA(Asn)/glutamyl-tRNA(Gln) amidotransferase subunit B